jgi:hypothetical protein
MTRPATLGPSTIHITFRDQMRYLIAQEAMVQQRLNPFSRTKAVGLLAEAEAALMARPYLIGQLRTRFQFQVLPDTLEAGLVVLRDLSRRQPFGSLYDISSSTSRSSGRSAATLPVDVAYVPRMLTQRTLSYRASSSESPSRRPSGPARPAGYQDTLPASQ